MIIRRMALFIRKHDWSAVVVEVVVVIVGLMLAFQLDGWVEQRGERKQETEYIERLISDLEDDIPAIQYAIDLASLRLRLVNLLMDVSSDPAVATARPVEFLGAVSQAAFTYTPSLTSHTFEDLRSTGNIRLLLSQEIRDALYEYYGFDTNQRQFRPLQFSTEHRHFELAAGVLSHEQEIFVQDNWRIFIPGEIDNIENVPPDINQVGEAAQRLHESPELVAWLPQVRALQIEQIGTHRSRLERANSVLDVLQQ